MKKYVFYICSVSLFISCRYTDFQHPSPIAKSYIDEVITLLQNNSINKNQINWGNFRNDVYRHGRGSKTIVDTYPSITYAITRLGDNHSSFVANNLTPDTNDLKPLPILQDEIVPENIGYIRIGFCLGNEQQSYDYINSASKKILKQDNGNIKGWIVDLRGNFGGNMWPMLAAIGPILGEGILGYFVFPDNSFYPWSHKNGKVYDENGVWAQSTNTYHLKSPDPYVAILTDNFTASSGEAVAIAFKGRDKTKFFGSQTFEVSTSNRSHTLSDSSRIILTESVLADRNKTKYGSCVYPDVKCQEKETLGKAINWITSRHN